MLINSYAKINLYLDIVTKRFDGYHEIETLFSTIDIHDSLKFVLTKKPGIQILSNIPELASVNNLVCKIANRIISDYRVETGLEIYLDKIIPIAAGLGGGSSNAAVTFFALKELLNIEMNDSYMNSVAAEYGSDINFFFSGGLALGHSRGEKIELLSDGNEMELLLVNPGLAISSAEAYSLVHIEKTGNHLSKLWHNSLEKGIRIKYPLMDKLLNELNDLGATESMMSGSGSTCIGLFTDKAKQSSALNYYINKKMWCKVVKTLSRRNYQECFRNLS